MAWNALGVEEFRVESVKWTKDTAWGILEFSKGVRESFERAIASLENQLDARLALLEGRWLIAADSARLSLRADTPVDKDCHLRGRPSRVGGVRLTYHRNPT